MTRKTPNQIVAYNLRRARLNHNWTQADVAEKLGISRANYTLIETSYQREERIRNHSADDLLRYAEIFDLPVIYFLLPPLIRDAADPMEKNLPEAVGNGGESISGVDYLERVWPRLDVTKILRRDHAVDALETRLNELSRVVTGDDLLHGISPIIEAQGQLAIEAALPALVAFFGAIRAFSVDVQTRVDELQELIVSEAFMPAWEKVIDELVRRQTVEGDEEE